MKQSGFGARTPKYIQELKETGSDTDIDGGTDCGAVPDPEVLFGEKDGGHPDGQGFQDAYADRR